tara:strand:- start:790 stop:1389 length:600 start_codon:yes stop_codon:yes gene_type:complete
MAKIKYTKSELKRQKDDLKRFERFLPMLQLKKQQLQLQIRRLDEELRRVAAERGRLQEEMAPWIAVLGGSENFARWFRLRELVLGSENVAGVHLPVFEQLELEPIRYDLFETPPWIDRAIQETRSILELDAREHVLRRRRELIARELIVTSQRVNLFERVKIPDARENIRRLKIFLGDQQAAAVVRGKLAKRKLQTVSS